MADFDLQIITTHQCNLRCKHCYGSFGVKERSEITTKEIKTALKDFKRLCNSLDINSDVHFSGGEPLLREDIYELIAYASKISVRPVLLTNGILLTKEVIEKLVHAGLDSCQISIESSNKELHESVRGQGTFDRVVEATRLLKSLTNIKTALAIAVTKNNLAEVEEYVEFALDRFGVDRVVFHRFVPMGRANIEDALSPEQHDTFLNRVITLKQKYGKDKVSYTDPTLYGKICGLDTSEDAIGGCSAGFAALSIDANGDVFPCPRLPLKVGNIRKNSIYQIYNNSKILDKLRNRNNLKGKCGKCSYRFQCGGCRAYAYSLNKDAFAEDKLCISPKNVNISKKN